MGVAGVSHTVVVGVGLVLVGDGGAVVSGIGDSITITSHLDGEGEGVTGSGGVGDA